MKAGHTAMCLDGMITVFNITMCFKNKIFTLCKLLSI